MKNSLIYSHASPYARAARICLRETGLLGQFDEVALHPFDNPKELIDANPLCKVPCLLIDGQSIFDSQVICEYFDNAIGGKLFVDLENNWSLKTLYSLTRGILDSAVAWQQDKMRDVEQRSEFWQQRFISGIERGLDYITKRIDQFPANFSALHVNLLVVLDYLDFRHPEYEWAKKHSNLVDFYQQNKSRISVTDTAPK